MHIGAEEKAAFVTSSANSSLLLALLQTHTCGGAVTLASALEHACHRGPALLLLYCCFTAALLPAAAPSLLRAHSSMPVTGATSAAPSTCRCVPNLLLISYLIYHRVHSSMPVTGATSAAASTCDMSSNMSSKEPDSHMSCKVSTGATSAAASASCWSE